MKYASIDIETTGLDPQQDQILQVAIVIEDTARPERDIDSLPFLYANVRHDRFSGSPVALAMNAKLIQEISTGKCVRPDTMETDMLDFLHYHAGCSEKIVAAGKNFASFDRQFLRVQYPRTEALFHHRSLDPAMLYLRSGDVVPPATDECLRRAGLPADIRHDALEDARNVIRLLRTRNW